MSPHAGGYSADPRIRWIESLPWIVAIAAFFALPEYLSLGARILIYILYALSLDLIVGYAGIITLGHSAYFGLGAYIAGILAAKAGISDPMVQLAAAATAQRRRSPIRHLVLSGRGRDLRGRRLPV